MSGLFWRIITLAGELSKSIKNTHKAFSPQFIFLNRCQICPLIAIFRCLNLETKALHLLQKEREDKKSLFFVFLFFEVEAVWYWQHLNMGLGVEKTITIRRLVSKTKYTYFCYSEPQGSSPTFSNQWVWPGILHENLRYPFLKETGSRWQVFLYDLEGAFQLLFHLHQTSIFY